MSPSLSPSSQSRTLRLPDTENTPLLANNSADQHEAVYQRFSPAEKRILLILVSACGLLPLFVSGTFIPSIPQIAKDLDSTGPVVSLAVSLSILATSVGSFIGSSYSTFYGRRPVYLVTLPLLFAGSMGVALSRNIPQLMVFRFIQTLGASPGASVGSAVIGDIYKLEKRGEAMGIYFGAILLGPAIAPFVGGATAHYASWRVMQFSIGVCAVIAYIFMLLFFRETSHPGTRGVDKLLASGKPLPKWRPVLLNPLGPLWILRSPNLFLVTLSGFLIVLSDFVLLVPLAYTIGARYGISNEALIGACFLPEGLGNMIAAPLSGRLSDKSVVSWREKRGGIWYPEDRLRITIYGALFLAPFPVIVFGFLTQYVPGNIALAVNLLCIFINGFGVDFVLGPSAAYVVDVMHSQSADAMAANYGFRSLLLSFSVAAILPMINNYGVLVTNTAAAALSWIGFVMLWVVIRYGTQLRAVVDVGYSTADNN